MKNLNSGPAWLQLSVDAIRLLLDSNMGAWEHLWSETNQIISQIAVSRGYAGIKEWEEEATGKNIHPEMSKLRKAKKNQNIESFMRGLGPFGIGIEMAPLKPFPWQRLASHSTVSVVLGTRETLSPGAPLSIPSLSLQDFKARDSVEDLIREQLELQSRVKTVHLEATNPSSTIDETLCQLRERSSVIVCLGAPHANPMSAYLANEIFERNGVEPRWKLQWSSKHVAQKLKDVPFADSIATDTTCRANREGIIEVQSRKLRAPRTPHSSVVAANSIHKSFDDCGILIADCSVFPTLIIAAGHGGCGSRACIDVLSRFDDVEKCFGRNGLPSHLLYEIVACKKTKRTEAPVDDMDPRSCQLLESVA